MSALEVAKKKFVESGVFSGLLLFLMGALLAWGVWVTMSVFSHASQLEKGKEIRLQVDANQWKQIEINTQELRIQRN